MNRQPAASNADRSVSRAQKHNGTGNSTAGSSGWPGCVSDQLMAESPIFWYGCSQVSIMTPSHMRMGRYQYQWSATFQITSSTGGAMPKACWTRPQAVQIPCSIPPKTCSLFQMQCTYVFLSELVEASLCKRAPTWQPFYPHLCQQYHSMICDEMMPVHWEA